MINPWISLFSELPLSKTEREVVKRFEADPEGRSFLPVADILRSHKLVEESLELLTEGVDRHPHFTVARVVLARELLQKGFVEGAFRALEDSPIPLRENLLAQKLRFRLSTLLELEVEAKATFHHLRLHQMLDPETKRLGDILELSGIQKARERLTKDFANKGINLILPEMALEVPQEKKEDKDLAEPFHHEFFNINEILNKPELNAFHVVPLQEIFTPGDSKADLAGFKSQAIELDSLTIAEIYSRQGHYAKSIGVYRRMLKLSPGNDLLKKKIAELSRLEKAQKEEDLTIDPELVDRMESLEIINQKIRFFNHLLERLR